MGGRYDATSVCNPIATLINPIGMDHMQYLGPRLEDIASEKFAAVKNGVDAFYAGDDETLIPLFLEQCEKLGASPHVSDRIAVPGNVKCGLRGTSFDYAAISGEMPGIADIAGLETPLLGHHQASNAVRAITVLLSLGGKFPDFSFLAPDVIKDGLSKVDCPGRREILPHRGRQVMIDGAHNAHAARALVSSISLVKTQVGGVKIGAMVLAVMGDKEIPPMLGILKKLDCPVYCTELPMERCARASELSRLSRLAGIRVAGCLSDPYGALCSALEGTAGDETVLCCGSLYLAGHLRRFLIQEISGQIDGFDATNGRDCVKI
jgi:dihydrofolate synthase/folylpolyglutamate synthase